MQETRGRMYCIWAQRTSVGRLSVSKCSVILSLLSVQPSVLLFRLHLSVDLRGSLKSFPQGDQHVDRRLLYGHCQDLHHVHLNDLIQC